MDLFDQKIKILTTHFFKTGPFKNYSRFIRQKIKFRLPIFKKPAPSKLFAIYEAQCHGGGKLGPVVPPVPTFWGCKCNLGPPCVQYSTR